MLGFPASQSMMQNWYVLQETSLIFKEHAIRLSSQLVFFQVWPSLTVRKAWWFAGCLAPFPAMACICQRLDFEASKGSDQNSAGPSIFLVAEVACGR